MKFDTNNRFLRSLFAGAHQHVKTGKLHAIAVSSAQRSSSLPDVPTFIESGVPSVEGDVYPPRLVLNQCRYKTLC
jgi:tripartite-type tricarboxylate transporter receptor subunit TctC